MSMAKKMISRLSVLAVLMVFLAACSKQTEYTNVIPADATAVASIDLKSLANKAGMNDKENEARNECRNFPTTGESDKQPGSIRFRSGSTDLYL